MNPTKNSVNTSIPQSRKVRGYEIKRMPIGAFLAATRLLNQLPDTVIRALFPQADGALEELKHLTPEGLQALLLRALAVLPGEAVRVFAELSGIPEGDLLQDPDVGLDGLAEMVQAWLEVNGIENFTRTARGLWARVRAVTATPGSNG